MRVLILAVFILMTSACSLNHGRPIANLQYLKTERLRTTGIYQIYFKSDVDLLGLFKSSIGQGLVCSLTDDLDFSQAHKIKQSGFGFIERVSADSLLYRADVIFDELVDGKGEEKRLKGTTLIPFLKVRDSISCVFRVHSTTYKTYFSKIMQVPSAELLAPAPANEL
ncbi:hypothetical protein [Pseudomonas sp. TWP3-2]|uniref:hypothetical protein n=1 Tax=Pseudomonas sp. TWP3-2 TaxID=2804574 RepID=UPI003CF5D857